MSDGLIAAKPLSGAIRAALTEPPAWTRLEPVSASGDPTPGLEARVFDPLWLLSRQWRFGEFQGEDAGSPIFVQVRGVTDRTVAWQPGSKERDQPFRVLAEGVPLDPLVEREAKTLRDTGRRQRADAGADLLDLFAAAGFDASALIAACAFVVDGVREALPPALRVVVDAVPDGLRAAESLEAAAPAQPSWLAGAPADLIAAVDEWLRWFRETAPEAAANDSWIPERLEYRFSVETGAPDSSTVLRAPVHTGGEIDWFSFDVDEASAAAPAGLGEAGHSVPFEAKAFASSLTYAGMPSDRYWEFEDGQMNFGQLDAQPHDLARLCLTEFALVYGNDWLAIPVEVPAGTLCRLERVEFEDTFGVRHEVPRASGEFRLFEITRSSGDGSLPALFVPPSVLNTLEGTPFEDVQFVRDETANLVWAIERTVQSAAGDPEARTSEPRPETPRRNRRARVDYDYLLATTVPPYWIPFVPVQDRVSSFFLRKGTMALDGADLARGALLARKPWDLMDEEVPRAGVRVRRVPCLARAADGRYLRWIAYRIGVGKGEASSGLQYDAAVLPK